MCADLVVFVLNLSDIIFFTNGAPYTLVVKRTRKILQVSSSFGYIIFAASWHALVLGRLSKEML